jgi:hypothetical protein
MKVLFLTNGVTEPASRFRVLQFVPHFEEAGVRCVLRTAYGRRYNQLAGTAAGPAYKVACRLKRAAYTLLADGYDVVFLQRTAIPSSALPERIAAMRNGRTIFDFDDSIFLGPDTRESVSRRRAFDQAIRSSAHVVAGNRYLAEQANAPGKTSVIPTVVDTDRYVPPAEPRDPARVVIGWMGTQTNFVFFPQLVPAVLRILAEFPETIFRVVSNATVPGLVGHPQVEQIPWSEKSEIPLLQSFDIGTMPLYDSEVARGKCGFKMIQYMAVGSAVVVSAVGANPDILGTSGAGRLVSGTEETYAALRELVTDAGVRRRMGDAGRSHAVAQYSVRSVLDRYLRLFEQVAAARPHP